MRTDKIEIKTTDVDGTFVEVVEIRRDGFVSFDGERIGRVTFKRWDVPEMNGPIATGRWTETKVWYARDLEGNLIATAPRRRDAVERLFAKEVMA